MLKLIFWNIVIKKVAFSTLTHRFNDICDSFVDLSSSSVKGDSAFRLRLREHRNDTWLFMISFFLARMLWVSILNIHYKFHSQAVYVIWLTLINRYYFPCSHYIKTTLNANIFWYFCKALQHLLWKKNGHAKEGVFINIQKRNWKLFPFTKYVIMANYKIVYSNTNMKFKIEL